MNLQIYKNISFQEYLQKWKSILDPPLESFTN